MEVNKGILDELFKVSGSTRVYQVMYENRPIKTKSGKSIWSTKTAAKNAVINHIECSIDSKRRIYDSNSYMYRGKIFASRDRFKYVKDICKYLFDMEILILKEIDLKEEKVLFV